jgi:hypothetical protein
MMMIAMFGALLHDPETEEALRAFAKDYGSPVGVVRAAAVLELGKLHNGTTRSKLAGLLTVDEDAVRIAAARSLGDFTEDRDKVSAVLMLALAPNAKAFDVEATILIALGKLGHDSALSTLHASFDSRDPKDTDFKVAKAAIRAAGLFRSRDSVGPLIDLGKRLERVLKGGGAKNIGPAGGAGVGIPGGGADPQTLRAQALAPVILKSLQAITGEKWIALAEWEIWWEKHRAVFKVDR